jgi:hypothetical protein
MLFFIIAFLFVTANMYTQYAFLFQTIVSFFIIFFFVVRRDFRTHFFITYAVCDMCVCVCVCV